MVWETYFHDLAIRNPTHLHLFVLVATPMVQHLLGTILLGTEALRLEADTGTHHQLRANAHKQH